MNHRGRRIVERLACERRYGIADQKGAEYSGHGKTYIEDGADTLANFKKVAERIGGTPEQVLLTYMLKHMDSITTTVREAAECKKDPKTGYYDEEHNPRHVYAASEGIVSRLDDLRNYADLLECLLVDLGSVAEPDPQSFETAEEIGAVYDDWEPTRTSVGEDDPQLPYPGTPEYDAESDAMLKKAGLTEGLDGVWRGASRVDESVAPDAIRETPICGAPVPSSPTMDKVRAHQVDL